MQVYKSIYHIFEKEEEMGKKKSSATNTSTTSSNNKKTVAGSSTGNNEDDWEDILNELKQENEAILAAAVVESVPVDTATTTSAATNHPSAAGEENGNDEEGGEPDEGGGAAAGPKKAKKKKKKKPAAAAAAEEGKGSTNTNTTSTSTTISARGRLVAERLRIQREEEERIQRLQEEEDRRIAELEAKEAEELRKKEEEKERKKLKQKEKIERQKMEGTYMTKAQKQKAKLAAERLEAMKAAGMLPTTALATNENNGNTTTMSNQAKLYNKKQKQQPMSKKKDEPLLSPPQPTLQPDIDILPQIEKPQEQQQQQQETLLQDHREEKKEEDSVLDEWDAESFDSFDPNLAQLEAKLQQVNTNTTSGDGINLVKGNTQLGQQHDEEEEEDLIAAEKKQELERLRILGLEREKREKMEAEKRAAFLAEQEELKRQEALVAQKKAEGKKRRMEQEKANLAARTRDHLRCPVVVIMGHVDTGKTKLLDKIRHTNVQEGEAGGITQQIGATFFEKKTLEQQTSRLNRTEQVNLTIPGMLVIDTPGHESFSNLRSRGSSLCDIAILVVDLMHGLEPQTIESLNMLRSKGTPFVVALNKIDRCYAWVTCPDAPIREALEKQTESTVSEFRSRASQAKLELAQQGVNSNIYWEMGDDDWENSVCCTRMRCKKHKNSYTREREGENPIFAYRLLTRIFFYSFLPLRSTFWNRISSHLYPPQQFLVKVYKIFCFCYAKWHNGSYGDSSCGVRTFRLQYWKLRLLTD